MRAALLFTCLISAPALAVSTETVQDNGAITEASKPAAKEKKVCKIQEAGSTSRVRKRICTTVGQETKNAERQTSLDDLRRIGGN